MTQSNAAANYFEKLATFKGRGAVLNSMAVGSTAESGKFYLSYTYPKGLQLVVVDPSILAVDSKKAVEVYDSASKEQWENPPSTSEPEPGAWGMFVDVDPENPKHHVIYLGTFPHAHLYKFDTQTTRFTDLGPPPLLQPLKEETVIWSLTKGKDGKIYGGMFPHAELFSYDPAAPNPSKPFENLGSMDPSNDWARECVADPDYRYIYVGTGGGTSSTKIVAYNIDHQPNESPNLLCTGEPGWPNIWLYRSDDDKKTVYGHAANRPTYKLSHGQDGQANLDDQNHAPPSNILAGTFDNKDIITILDLNDQVLITHHDGKEEHYKYDYPGNDLSIFRVGTGPDGNIYAGTIMPVNLASLSPAYPEKGFTSYIRGLGNGEVYSLLPDPDEKKLYIGAYSAKSTFITYAPGDGLTCVPDFNDLSWRPKTLIAAPNEEKLLYAGSPGKSGHFNGALFVWDLKTNRAEYYDDLFPDQGIASLIVAKSCIDISGSKFCLVGGSTIRCGDGTIPKDDPNAMLFTVDPTDPKTLKNKYPIPNVDKVTGIHDLIVVDPEPHHVYGIANDVTVTPQKSYLFIFDPTTGTFVNDSVQPLDFYIDDGDSAPYNSVAIGSDSKIWGLTADGVFTIDVKTNTPRWVADAPQKQKITSGFGFVKAKDKGDKIYFGSGADLWVYHI